MSKKFLQQQDEASQANSDLASESESGTSFKSLEEQLQELDDHLSQQIEQQEKISSNASEKSFESSEADSPGQMGSAKDIAADPDKGTQEFIQLADFISKERNKKAPTKDPAQTEKVGKLKKYKSVKSKEFENLMRQKGLQINKAA